MVQMTTTAELLRAAQAAPTKDNLRAHLPTIEALRAKNYTFRDIAAFLTEHGVPADHSKVFRLIAKHEKARAEAEAFQVPAAQNYVAALTALDSKGRISASAKAMLCHHYQAHNRTVTYTDLARAGAKSRGGDSDAASHRSANSAYGKFGRLLGEQLGMAFAPSDDRGAPFYSSSIGLGNPVTPPSAEFQLVMHHELAKALGVLGWCTANRGSD